MSDKSIKNKSFFAIFINLIGILSAVLYFAGWMYRLAYYQRFELNIMDLEFPFESYLLIPIASVFSSLLQLILFTNPVLLVLYFLLGILVIFALFVGSKFVILFAQKNLSQTFQNKPIFQEARRFYQSINKLYIVEAFLVSMFLFLLFTLCWVKGFKDGNRDLVENTSLLPKVKVQALGNIPLKQNKDWRLLLRQNDWIYLVATSKEESSDNAQVVALSKGESGDKSIILEPKVR